MNIVEKKVYDVLKGYPGLKFFVRNIYQDFCDLIMTKKEYFYKPIIYKENHFFGFHDVSPFSFDNTKILSNELVIPLRMPLEGESLNVGYFNFDGENFNEYVEVGKSTAWNYHKGCRLQWLDANRLIYNTKKSSRLCSVIYDINNKDDSIIDYPIDSVSNKGIYATSFSYKRLEKYMPGYGYICDDNAFLEECAPNNTGLFILNLKTGLIDEMISINDLVSNIDDQYKTEKFKHYVTHSEFSLDDKYISFFHRWVSDDVRKRYTRLLIYDRCKKNIIEMPTGLMSSHYMWISGKELIAYCNVDGHDSHVIFSVDDVISYKVMSEELLNVDGHQTVVDKNKFIIDTYPDKNRIAHLYMIDVEKNERELLAGIYSPKEYQTRDFKRHIACDIHPRLSRDKKYLSFDAIREGKRSHCIMRVR